ncbi:MAG: sugar transferase [candidate division Zixibacteria bacterium]|nr:sugar transferase [candidate division Zixibacteria bacterium]
MLRQNLTMFKRLHFLLDLGLTAASFYLAIFFRENFSSWVNLGPLERQDLYKFIFFILPIWAFFLLLKEGCYEYRGKPFKEIFKNTGAVVLKSFGVLLVVLFVTKSLDQNRGVLLLFVLLNFLSLLSIRKIISGFLSYLRRRGYNFKNVLIIGTGALARDFVEEVKNHPEHGYKILGFLDWDQNLNGNLIKDFPVIGTLKDLPDLLKNNHVDYAVYGVCRRFLNLIEDSLLVCEEMGVPTCLLADFFPLRFSKKRMGEFQNKPAIMFSTAPDGGTTLYLKCFVDRALALLGIVLISPLLLGIAFLIKLTSKGPVFFKQQRCGLNGRKFTLLKFRTMVENAEELKASLLEKNEMDGPVFKMEDDPRLTKVGKVLRKFSLDELPQIFNVLWGDMSLVGPRPPLPEEVSQYDLWHRRKLSMKPGITCLWQVNGRNNINFERWMKMDLEYIDNWSLWLDTKILFKTIPAVILGIGAK